MQSKTGSAYAILTLTLLLFGAVPWVHAEELPLTLHEVRSLVLLQEPGVEAARQRALSLSDKAVAAGSLPDPQFKLGVMSLPVDSFDFDREPMTQKQIGFEQMFPPAGSRQARRTQFERQAGAVDQLADARVREVLRKARDAWLETWYWQRAQQTVQASRELFVQLVKVTRSIYSVGRQNQHDMVRAELELSRLDDRLLSIDEQLRRNRAALQQWTGSAASRPLADRLPDWNTVPQAELLEEKLLKHPLLLSAQARIEAADAGIEIAESRYKPAWGIDVTYGQRDGIDVTGEPRDDLVSVMVTVGIPLFTGNRQDREVSAAVRERAAVRNERDAALRDLKRRLDSAYARWEQLSFRIGLYDQTILQQSHIQAEASLQAYQSDTGDFADVMRAYTGELNTRLELIRLQVDRAQTWAELDYLAGLDEPAAHIVEEDGNE